MDYAIHIVVEKVAISSQEVIKRDTITGLDHGIGHFMIFEVD